MCDGTGLGVRAAQAWDWVQAVEGGTQEDGGRGRQGERRDSQRCQALMAGEHG